MTALSPFFRRFKAKQTRTTTPSKSFRIPKQILLSVGDSTPSERALARWHERLTTCSGVSQKPLSIIDLLKQVSLALYLVGPLLWSSRWCCYVITGKTPNPRGKTIESERPRERDWGGHLSWPLLEIVGGYAESLSDREEQVRSFHNQVAHSALQYTYIVVSGSVEHGEWGVMAFC